MKICFLQILASSAVWICCHAPVGVASVAPKWEQLQGTNSALLEQVERDYTHDIAPDIPVNVGQMQVSKINKSNSPKVASRVEAPSFKSGEETRR